MNITVTWTDLEWLTLNPGVEQALSHLIFSDKRSHLTLCRCHTLLSKMEQRRVHDEYLIAGSGADW